MPTAELTATITEIEICPWVAPPPPASAGRPPARCACADAIAEARSASVARAYR